MKVLSALLALCLAVSGIQPVRADDYPSKPIHLVVGYLAGGATDYAARVLADGLSAKLKQTVIVDNRPGAASAIAINFVAHSEPDGYTLLFGNADGITILPAVKPTVPFQIPDSLTFISKTGPGRPAESLGDREPNSRPQIRSLCALIECRILQWI